MSNQIDISQLFTDTVLVEKIKTKLPNFFRIAELESSRAGKIGMEVGSLREKVIIALLMHKFGEDKVDPNLPITEPEADVLLDGEKISIKTITGNGGVKAVWTVDAKSAAKFISSYTPQCGIILVQIFWNKREGGLFYIPLSVQQHVFRNLGRVSYLNMPKPGTNPRGVEFSKKAIAQMTAHDDTLKTRIDWVKENIEYDVYERWVSKWEEP